MEEEIDLDTVLSSWRSLYQNVNSLTEAQLKTLLNYEAATQRRQSFLVKMHQRFSKLRANRERLDLLEGRMM